MKLKILSYLSFVILIFGFCYLSYHVGLYKGKQHERIHGENVVLMSDCFESALFTKCTHTHLNSEPFKKLYEEVLIELKKETATTAGSAGNNSKPISSRYGAPGTYKMGKHNERLLD